jgi:hypothetical protein
MRFIPRTIVVLSLAVSCAHAAFPVQSNIATSDVSKIRGNFRSFKPWRWAGYNSQSCTIYVENGSGSAVTLNGYSVAVKISKRTHASTPLVTYISKDPGDVTVTNSNFTFSVPYTNIPPNDTYLAEAWAFEGATTNQARTLAQWKIEVTDSLYDEDDSTYPWPAQPTNLASYLTIAQAASTYITETELPTNSTLLAPGPVDTYVLATDGTTNYWTNTLQGQITANLASNTNLRIEFEAGTNTLQTSLDDLDTRYQAGTNTVDSENLSLDGIDAMTGDLDMGGNSITNIGTNSIVFESGERISTDGSNIYYRTSAGATQEVLNASVQRAALQTQITANDADIADNAADILVNRDLIGLNTAYIMYYNDMALYDSTPGWFDWFTDETGVNTDAGSNMTYVAGSDVYRWDRVIESDDGITLHLKLAEDDATTNYTDSTGDYSPVLYGGDTTADKYEAGKISGAAHRNGSDDYIFVPTTDFQAAGFTCYTFMAWIKLDTYLDPFRTLADIGNGEVLVLRVGSNFGETAHTNRLNGVINNGGWSYLSSSNVIALATWTHVAFVRSNDFWSIYVDSVFAG